MATRGIQSKNIGTWLQLDPILSKEITHTVPVVLALGGILVLLLHIVAINRQIVTSDLFLGFGLVVVFAASLVVANYRRRLVMDEVERHDIYFHKEAPHGVETQVYVDIKNRKEIIAPNGEVYWIAPYALSLYGWHNLPTDRQWAHYGNIAVDYADPALEILQKNRSLFFDPTTKPTPQQAPVASVANQETLQDIYDKYRKR